MNRFDRGLGTLRNAQKIAIVVEAPKLLARRGCGRGAPPVKIVLVLFFFLLAEIVETELTVQGTSSAPIYN